MAIHIRRRDFISLLGNAAAAWPLAARGQPSERVRRVGVLTHFAADDPEGQSRIIAFEQAMRELGWAVGRNLQIDYRWAAGNPDRFSKYAAELVALAPDVVLAAGGTALVVALQQATATVPIVFMWVADPVGAGLVESLARPGGNATGFTVYEYSMSGKWIELLKEIAPRVTRAAVVRELGIGGTGQFGAIQSVASSLGVELFPIGVRDAGEIERAIVAFSRGSNGGLIVTAGPSIPFHRHQIIALAARLRLPAGFFVASGGLLSYGPDPTDQFRRTAGYVDRILKGEKPADLPVQVPTKYDLVINLTTAKVLGLEVPAVLLARADEVIE
jgi:putative tryptophan/tyrosine transport system substrate-binding protein